MSWQASTRDTDGYWDAGGPPRLSTAAGITKVRQMGSLALQTSSVASGILLSFQKNGAAEIPGQPPASARAAPAKR